MSEKLRVVTLNIHKGLSHFNRRLVIHELRDGLDKLDPDLVFLQEVQGMNRRFKLRYAASPAEPQHEFLAGDRWQHVYASNAVYDHGHHGNANRRNNNNGSPNNDSPGGSWRHNSIDERGTDNHGPTSSHDNRTESRPGWQDLSPYDHWL